MFDFLTDLSSAIDFEQLIKGISDLIDGSSEDSASEAAESTEAASN
ncbi:hypothetical protein [Corynebacterium confusum]|nr:hypothetical protein [Corynebacterium confusum]WJY90581.1 hypothetical protein CCONF_10435 [Corynebacterium confusum]